MGLRTPNATALASSTCESSWIKSLLAPIVNSLLGYFIYRYRNFERLHRHLKDIANYTLHLPPKRIFSSSTEDAFVHQRCIQLDKYLQVCLSVIIVPLVKRHFSCFLFSCLVFDRISYQLLMWQSNMKCGIFLVPPQRYAFIFYYKSINIEYGFVTNYSFSSMKNYSFGKSPSVMRSLAGMWLLGIFFSCIQLSSDFICIMHAPIQLLVPKKLLII